jgi:hypothetical protein
MQVYPLYEAALRAHRGQSLADNHRESSELYAEYAQVAAQNPIAWTHGKDPDTADTIGKITKRNRMICLPCKRRGSLKCGGPYFADQKQILW